MNFLGLETSKMVQLLGTGERVWPTHRAFTVHLTFHPCLWCTFGSFQQRRIALLEPQQGLISYPIGSTYKVHPNLRLPIGYLCHQWISGGGPCAEDENESLIPSTSSWLEFERDPYVALPSSCIIFVLSVQVRLLPAVPPLTLSMPNRFQPPATKWISTFNCQLSSKVSPFGLAFESWFTLSNSRS